jgi:hypothetical protein
VVPVINIGGLIWQVLAGWLGRNGTARRRHRATRRQIALFGRSLEGSIRRNIGRLIERLAAPARLVRRQVVIIIRLPIIFRPVIVGVRLIRVGRRVVWIIMAVH